MSRTPSISYYVAMPGGELPLNDEVARTLLPMERSGRELPAEASVTFGGYFQSLGKMLSDNHFALPLAGVRHQLGEDAQADQVREWRVVAEKHGAFYHPARVEAVTDRGTALIAANVALSDSGIAAASREFEVLDSLGRGFSRSFTPAAYGKGRAPCLLSQGGVVEAEAFFCQWYEGYCEFHLSCNPASQAQEIVVWDNAHGHFFMKPCQAAALYEKAAAILAYYYDPGDFRQIFPWHHAAGDFVVKALQDDLDVRLITVRQYQGMLEAEGDTDPETRLEAALYFLVNLTMHMRLDRIDGVGDLAWADGASVYPTLRGAFQGFALRGLDAGQDPEFAAALLGICREMPREYWEELCFQLVAASSPQSPDRPFLLTRGGEHAQALVEAFFKSRKDPFFVDKGAVLL